MFRPFVSLIALERKVIVSLPPFLPVCLYSFSLSPFSGLSPIFEPIYLSYVFIHTHERAVFNASCMQQLTLQLKTIFSSLSCFCLSFFLFVSFSLFFFLFVSFCLSFFLSYVISFSLFPFFSFFMFLFFSFSLLIYFSFSLFSFLFSLLSFQLIRQNYHE